jgi:deoxyribodipyrimidine photolyase
VQSYNGDLLHEPWDIYDESGYAYTTFDPFWNRCLQMQMKTYSLIPPCQLILAQGTTINCYQYLMIHARRISLIKSNLIDKNLCLFSCFDDRKS